MKNQAIRSRLRSMQSIRKFRSNRGSLYRLIPNMVTLAALCAGLTAMRFALENQFTTAFLAVVLAAVLDGLDGRIARMIGATSKFGAELDSLSDFVSFGVAPAFILYLWILPVNEASTSNWSIFTVRLSWAVALIYSAAMALRLARFNATLDDHDSPAWMKRYFVGVPAPMGSALAFLPMIYQTVYPDLSLRHPLVIDIWLLIVAGLMVSRIPTFSAKRISLSNRWVVPILMAVMVIVAGLATAPWLTFAVVGTLYFASIPLTWWLAIGSQKAAVEETQTPMAEVDKTIDPRF
ncbi:MAG: phosphatidylcholine/phosphatidylserine synthase [Candidatus Pacebacteria bacterium]|nr:phosphatidylcholine/phosphatidylserine synthase [Candidatus Paceibacterota bacterium]